MEATSTLYRSDATLLREMMGVAAQHSVVRAVILMGRSAAAVALMGLSHLSILSPLFRLVLLAERWI